MKTKPRKYFLWVFAIMLLVLYFRISPQKEVSAQDSHPTAADVIQAVNQLRIAHGLLPLNTHPVLMQIAEWEANAIAGGAPGHTRPDGLTLGQWLISLGYPLSGDLSLDGYRSENWVAAQSAQQAIEIWLMDGPHTNTMLSPDRSDIGAAIAVSDQVYIVLETALQTNSGQMQSDAYPIQTAIASDGYSGDSSVPQYIIPVKRSTARPDGDVVHQVKYGQSLWSIAITYNTTIEQIRLWNNLGDTIEIYNGQILLVQKGATQPPPATHTPAITNTPYTVDEAATKIYTFPTATGHPTSTLSIEHHESEKNTAPEINTGMVILIVLLIIVLGLFASWATTRQTR